MDHSNTVKVLQVLEDDLNYALVYESMHGSLKDFVAEKGLPLAEEQVHKMMIPIFQAVFNCHRMGIEHRRIRPENLLLSDDR